jgi:hypothetical protein
MGSSGTDIERALRGWVLIVLERVSAPLRKDLLTKGVRSIKRLACSLLFVFSVFSIEVVADTDFAQAYAEKTDQELTELTAQWDSLGDTERVALLTEVKMRMARSKGREGVIRIRTQRRYGRIIRQPDGSVLRIETRVVRVHSAPPETQSYGVGFEQRAASKEAEQEPLPVLTVKDPSP